MQKFVEWLEENIKEIANIPAKKMIFGEEEADRFNKATNCWICKGKFDDKADENGYKKNEKVKDHCHYTGNIEVPPIMNVISIIGNLNLHLWYFIMLVVMIVIYL